MKLRHILVFVVVLGACQWALAQYQPTQQTAYGPMPADVWPEMLRWLTSTVIGGGTVAALARGALRNEIRVMVQDHVEKWHNRDD